MTDDDARRVRGEYDIIMERRRNAAAREKEKRERKKALADMSKKEKEGKKDKSEKTSERKQKVRGGVARVRVGRAASRSARKMQRRRSSTITACGCCKSCRERAMMALSHGEREIMCLLETKGSSCRKSQPKCHPAAVSAVVPVDVRRPMPSGGL